MNTIHEMLEYLHSNDFEAINLHYTDLFGGMHTLTLPLRGLNDERFSFGVPFDGSSVPGFARIERGDMALLPQPETLFIDKIADEETIAGVICNIVEADSGNPIGRDPRTILNVVEKLLDDELNAQSMWLPELEFFLFTSVDFEYDDFGAFHRFELPEVAEFRDEFTTTLPLTRRGGYHAPIPSDSGYHFRSEVVALLESCGIGVRYHHHEASAGQHEIELLPHSPMRTADGLVLAKYFARSLAQRHDLMAIFLPKPLYAFPGSGMHFHQWLKKDDVSLFWDENGTYSHLSEIALNYIAGLLIHASALTALTNPSTNSFRRLVPGFEAPTKLFFGIADRSAAVRIPKYVDSPRKKRIEYRPPDAMTNPYLAIAGMALAGLDGIRRKLDPIEMGFGPFDNAISSWKPDEQAKLKNLPKTLTEAAHAMRKDREFLIADGIFTNEVIQYYTETLISDEQELLGPPTPYEIEKYIGK